MTDKNRKETGEAPGGAYEASDASRPTLTLDVAAYQSFLDDAGISEDQKQELLETIWSILTSCIELGFGVHPLQEPGSSGADSLSPLFARLVATTIAQETEDETQTMKAGEPRERIDV